MIEIVKVAGVESIGGFRLRIWFSDGSFGDHDFSSMAAEAGEMIEPLRDSEYFARAFTEMGVITWPNGFDIDSIELQREMAAAGELRRDAA